MRARLIDLEGQTVAELAVHPMHDGYPPLVIELAAAPKIAAMIEPEDPIYLSIKKLVYELERVDGGGTLIYRRRTGPWG